MNPDQYILNSDMLIKKNVLSEIRVFFISNAHFQLSLGVALLSPELSSNVA